MKDHYGTLVAVLLGAVWQTLGVAVWGVLASLLGGVSASLPLGTGLLSGAALGAVYGLWAHDREARWEHTAVPAAVGFVVLMALSGLAPFSLGMGEALFWGTGGALLVSLVSARATRASLDDMNLKALTRHHYEIAFIRAMRGIGFTFFVSLVALPFYVMLMTSFKSQQSLLANPLDFSIDLSKGWGLFLSYWEVLTTFNFANYILVSTLVSVCTVIVTLAFAVPGAYAVSRLRFPGRAVLSRSILLIYMFPAIVLVIPLYSVFSQVGLRDSLVGLLVVYPATTIPVSLYMLQGYFRGIPAELEEAGLIDGATRVGVILRITLPLSMPALASVALYVFMIAWNEFLFAFMFLDDPQIFTLSRGLVSLNSSEVPRQFLMAGSVIVTVPILIIFLWAERFMVAGLTAGSVKG